MKPIGQNPHRCCRQSLRPLHLKEAHARFDGGTMAAEELRRIEDDAIGNAVRFQEAIGLDVITDGEFRRLNFQDSFSASVSGFDARAVDLSFVESLSREGKPLQRWDPIGSLTARPFCSAVQSRKSFACAQLPLEEYPFVSAWPSGPPR